MALIITPIIGKRDLRARYVIARAPEGTIVESLRRVQSSAKVVGLRLRPEICDPEWRKLCSSQVRDAIISRMEQFEEDKELSFGTLREFDPVENRTVTREVITLAPGEQTTVTAQAATALLDHPMNGYLLEEVDLGQDRPRRSNRDKRGIDASLVEQGVEGLKQHNQSAAVQSELEALKAALAAKGIDPASLVIEGAKKGPSAPGGRGRRGAPPAPPAPPAPDANDTPDPDADTPV